MGNVPKHTNTHTQTPKHTSTQAHKLPPLIVKRPPIEVSMAYAASVLVLHLHKGSLYLLTLKVLPVSKLLPDFLNRVHCTSRVDSARSSLTCDHSAKRIALLWAMWGMCLQLSCIDAVIWTATFQLGSFQENSLPCIPQLHD